MKATDSIDTFFETAVGNLQQICCSSVGQKMEKKKAISCDDELLNCGHGLLNRGHGLISRGHDLLSRGHELLSRGHKLLNRGNSVY